MTAPSATFLSERLALTGDPMRKGYRSVIAFEANPIIKFWEKGVQPPGMDGGDNIDATTQHNDVYRTFGVPALITLTDFSTRVAYHPSLYTDILSLINVEGAITVHFPTGTHVSFFGRLRSFEPDEMTEESQPEATINISPTNWDPVGATEEPPVYGTATS